MARFSKIKLSGSTDGRNIKVAATSTPGTTIHTADSTNTDEIWIWAVNSDTTDRKLTVEFGGTTAPDDLVEYTVPAEDGLYLIIPGLTLTNSVVVKAFAATANVITINGYVNRFTG
jgi:hypothetical protein